MSEKKETAEGGLVSCKTHRNSGGKKLLNYFPAKHAVMVSVIGSHLEIMPITRQKAANHNRQYNGREGWRDWREYSSEMHNN